ALKLLKPQTGARAAARARLQREAQALAKLDHPNVVGVHDVGVHADQLFVAMEFVAGQTLGAWLEQPRPWPEVVSKFVEAGRGLAAAHEAGLVHRDFKPDNVMIGDDGRVRVMDFGLARTDGDQASRTGAADLDRARAPLHAAVTDPGSLVGTLAYMAPEQFASQPADPRSDQFSFCVSLYQGLYGERPFAVGGLAELLEAMEREAILAPPRGSTVPIWLRKIVLRGLARDPARRWPSMAALLDALLDDPSARRRKWWVGVGVLALLGGAAWGVITANHQQPQVCTGMDEKLVGVWDDSRRAEVEAAMLATELDYAAATWQRVEALLDAYADAWIAAREHACLTSHRGEQSDALLDLRMACLDERLDHLRATVQELATADAMVVEKAVQAVAGLPRLDRCADAEALAARIPPPEDPAIAERVQALDAGLIEAGAKQYAGRYDESLARVEAVVAEASTLGYQPLSARAYLQQGTLLERLGQYESSATALERAYVAATVQRMSPEAASAAAWLMYVYGYDLSRLEDGRRWAVHAEPLSRAAGTNQVRVEYLESASALAEFAGELAEARDHQQRALELREAEWGPEHPNVAAALHNLGLIAELQGDYEQARSYHERALALHSQALGPEHPKVASTLNNLGTVAYSQGELDDAERLFQQALTLAERALGPNHPQTANALDNLGAVAFARADYAAAREYRSRALDILIETRGPDHPLVANALNNLGNIEIDQGNTAEARELHERALAIRERVQGPDHPDVAGNLGSLGDVARERGDLAASRDYFERSLAVY
ncbi:MAG TPA: serine/threonine-protein kinase, partial [Enhygromyxa sp.]|nr:serine/threonine-protein kinase [Enhygromyxa sp.]